MFCMPGWILRRRATASATAPFGPRPCSSLTGGAYALRRVVIGRDLASDGALVIIVHNNRRGSSSLPSGRHGRSTHQY
jgi:hypothetical protein